MLSGSVFDAGDGWDYCKNWRVDGIRLLVRDDYGNSQRCLFTFKEDRKTLVLRDCPAAGDWLRDDKLTEAKRGSWTCRMQTYSARED